MLTFLPGQTVKNVPIHIIDDTAKEGPPACVIADQIFAHDGGIDHAIDRRPSPESRRDGFRHDRGIAELQDFRRAGLQQLERRTAPERSATHGDGDDLRIARSLGQPTAEIIGRVVEEEQPSASLVIERPAIDAIP